MALVIFHKPILFSSSFFYSQTCPHCVQQKPLMKYIDQHNEEVKLYAYEVSEHPEKWPEFLVNKAV
ncbi:MAG: hypothetical protein QNJ41_14845 [Xenococcaceae cyanobacterium MO_188.B32]|nr:hypothetical protein [Xenococcaceae cyanobacterium MO_188.B32]